MSSAVLVLVALALLEGEPEPLGDGVVEVEPLGDGVVVGEPLLDAVEEGESDAVGEAEALQD